MTSTFKEAAKQATSILEAIFNGAQTINNIINTNNAIKDAASEIQLELIIADVGNNVKTINQLIGQIPKPNEHLSALVDVTPNLFTIFLEKVNSFITTLTPKLTNAEKVAGLANVLVKLTKHNDRLKAIEQILLKARDDKKFTEKEKNEIFAISGKSFHQVFYLGNVDVLDSAVKLEEFTSTNKPVNPTGHNMSTLLSESTKKSQYKDDFTEGKQFYEAHKKEFDRGKWVAIYKNELISIADSESRAIDKALATKKITFEQLPSVFIEQVGYEEKAYEVALV
jgi:hypothetical protein